MNEVKQSNYKLTPEQIKKAKSERFHGALISDLAKKYNVSRPTMSEALRGTYHKHVQTKYDKAIQNILNKARAKLTDKQVVWIRKQVNLSAPKIALKFEARYKCPCPVDHTSINAIKRGKTYKWVK